MELDPEILKQLIITFKAELNERLQIIVNGLLALEKENLNAEERNQVLIDIFRSAHNIKGTAGSLNISDINKIAHHIESLFALVQKKQLGINPALIDLCFEAIDKMKLAMQAYSENQSISFDLDDLIARLEQFQSAKDGVSVAIKKSNIKKQNEAPVANEDESTVRVPINNIDRISVLVEELQGNKIAIDNHYLELAKLTTKMQDFSHLWKQLLLMLKNNANDSSADVQKFSLASADDYAEITNTISHMQKDMHARINELDILFNALQEETRTLRLVPAANFLCTLPRYVRDLCHALNKEVELKISGDEVKMDKMVLENLKEPIIHILRNSIDHGIESPEERKTKGKSEKGQIQIDIRDEGGQILVKISDDGCGIDLKKIAKIALEKKLIAKAALEKLTDNELVEFIFRPGFSTKELITNVSGRGVGLDVVKNNIEKINGHLNFKTEINKGTVLELYVPLTLASERGFLVSAAGQIFVVPTNAVQRVMLAPADAIVNIEGTQAIMLDNHPVQLYSLASILSFTETEFSKQKQLPLLFIKRGKNSIALLVDEILGEREIVVKPLQAPLTKVPCVAGGTLAANNQVVVVLDALGLINTAINVPKSQRVKLRSETPEITSSKPHILVVDDSITTRALEKNILESKNYKVTTAVNGKEAWDLLQKEAFSLLITDIVMPVMDGLTLTEQVKKSEKLQHMPVIIVTSLGSNAEKKRGIDVGADAYIIKSDFESGVLLDIVEQLV